MAAGWGAQAVNNGTFVWADSTGGASFKSAVENSFIVRASGGVGIDTNSPGHTLEVNGDINLTGGLTKSYSGTLAHVAPFAFGNISLAGAIYSGTGNFTCSWNTSEYLIAITGVTYFYSTYTTVVTINDINTPLVATTNSIGGNLIVKIYNLSGNPVQAPFEFVIYHQ